MSRDEISSIANAIANESKNLLEDYIRIFMKIKNVTIDEIELVEQRFETKIVWCLRIKEKTEKRIIYSPGDIDPARAKEIDAIVKKVMKKKKNKSKGK